MSEQQPNKVTDAAQKSTAAQKQQSREPNVIRNNHDMEEEEKEVKPQGQPRGNLRGKHMKKLQIDEFKRLIGSKKQLHRAMTFQGKNNRPVTTLI